jgi:hypothetical protein
MRLGAPRRLFISRQGRTDAGAGPAADEWAQERRQAGQSSGVRGGAGDGGVWCASSLLLSIGQDQDGANKETKARAGRA